MIYFPNLDVPVVTRADVLIHSAREMMDTIDVNDGDEMPKVIAVASLYEHAAIIAMRRLIKIEKELVELKESNRAEKEMTKDD